jgi:hypothetical protein
MMELKRFFASIDHRWRKAIKKIYILNPNRLFFLAIHMLTPQLSPKFKDKIEEIYYWKMLRQFIETDSIRLPMETK